MSATPLPRVIWLAGFPGNGTVKVQTMLARILYGDVESLSWLDQVVRPMFDSPDLPPDPHARGIEPIFTHHAPSKELRARYNAEAIIHVVRHPVDVAFSLGPYLAGYDPAYADWTAAERAARIRALTDQFLDFGTAPLIADLGCGTWSLHAYRWTVFALTEGLPYLRLRLEDVRADELGAARQIAAFVGQPPDDPVVADAVRAASFDNSRRLEEAEIALRRPGRFYLPHLQRCYDAGWRYHGKGGGDYGRGELTADAWANAKAVFGRTAADFGYTFP